MDKWIEIFKAGTWKDATGKVHTYSQGDLDTIVAVNDPAKRTDHRQVPLVIGHPKPSHPAFGVVGALKREDAVLYMQGKDVVPEFADAVNKGYYRKVSICIDPVTKELEHVGFLGAVQPAVSGLADAQFSAPKAESVFLEYSRWSGDGLIASLFQGMRDYLIEKEGLEKADTILPQWSLDSLKEEAATEDMVPAGGVDYNKAAPAALEAPAAPVPSAREVALEAENATLRASVAAQEAAARQAEHVAFCQSLINEGRLLPAQREEALALLATTSAPELAAFSKGNTPGAGALLKTFLSKLTQQVKVGGEIATNSADPVNLQDPVALTAKAAAYMAEQAKLGITLTAADAVTHIQKGAVR